MVINGQQQLNLPRRRRLLKNPVFWTHWISWRVRIRDCLWTVSGLSLGCLSTVSGLSLDFLWTVSGLSLDCLWTVSVLSLDCLQTVSGLSLDWCWTVPRLSLGCFWTVAGYTRAYPGVPGGTWEYPGVRCTWRYTLRYPGMPVFTKTEMSLKLKCY